VGLCFLILSQVFILLSFSGCSKNRIINEDKFVKLYADLVIQQDTLNTLNYKTDSLKIAVFKRYDVNEEDYKNTIKYYNQDPSRWEKFFNKVTAYLEGLKKKNAK
jgi:Domain of unknown function (DUF4296)